MAPPMPVPGGNANYGGFEDGDDDANFIRYGRIPQRVPRRYKTVKRIQCVARPLRPCVTHAFDYADCAKGTM